MPAALFFCDGRMNPLGLDVRRFLVAEDESGQVVGCGQLAPLGSPGALELRSLVVEPGNRSGLRFRVYGLETKALKSPASLGAPRSIGRAWWSPEKGQRSPVHCEVPDRPPFYTGSPFHFFYRLCLLPDNVHVGRALVQRASASWQSQEDNSRGCQRVGYLQWQGVLPYQWPLSIVDPF